jgi:hypothetical protein
LTAVSECTCSNVFKRIIELHMLSKWRAILVTPLYQVLEVVAGGWCKSLSSKCLITCIIAPLYCSHCAWRYYIFHTYIVFKLLKKLKQYKCKILKAYNAVPVQLRVYNIYNIQVQQLACRLWSHSVNLHHFKLCTWNKVTYMCVTWHWDMLKSIISYMAFG